MIRLKHGVNRRAGKGSVGLIIALVLGMGFLFVVGILILGFVFFSASRAKVHQAHAVVERAMAQSQAERQRMEQQLHGPFHKLPKPKPIERTPPRAARPYPANGPYSVPNLSPPQTTGPARPSYPSNPPYSAGNSTGDEGLIRVAQREITISVDQEGQVELDGKTVAKDQLKAELVAARKGRESTLTVVVRADRRCQFEHVAFVLSICKQIDVPDVRIATSDSKSQP